LKIAGLRGDAKAKAEALAERDKKIRGIDSGLAETLRSSHDESGKDLLSGDARDKLKASANAQKFAAEADYQNRLREMESSQLDEQAQANSEANEKILESQRTTQRESLELGGKFFEAKLQGVKDSTDQEIRELNRKHDEEVKDLNPNGLPKQLADQRLKDSVAAARARGEAQSKTATEYEKRDSERQQESHDREISGKRAGIVEARLRAAGDDTDAERVGMAEDHQQKLAALEAKKKSDLEAHGERRQQIEKQYGEDVGAENESFGANVEAFNKGRERQFAAKDVHAGGEFSAGMSGVRNFAVNDGQKNQGKIQEELKKLSRESAKHLEQLKGMFGAFLRQIGVAQS
jgi:hypothetical protein